MKVQRQPDAGAAQRTERPVREPSMSHDNYIEAGAKELQLLYDDASMDICRLLSQQRLVLVLDLDHTLINSARQSEIDSEHVLVFTVPLALLSIMKRVCLASAYTRTVSTEFLTAFTFSEGVHQSLPTVGKIIRMLKG